MAAENDKPHEDHAATEFEEFLEEGSPNGGSSDEEILSALDPDATPAEESPDQGAAVDVLTRELNQFKDTALRLQADFENYRKRVAAQQTAEIDRALGKLVEGLLPVLDACEAAFTHGVEGVEPIWSQLMGVLQKQGLEALDLAGKPFDPALADAVVHEEGDDSDGPVVSDVLRTGYTWKGKTLRAAMVKVRG
jgi:molecular chaperone GrpE